MKRQYMFIVILALLLSLSLALPLAAQEEAGVARVRIGYYAFDPRENDTYIDGQPVSWSFASGWAQVLREAALDLRFETATPYFDVPGGSHSIAFVEGGSSLDSAFLGPEVVEFQPGHTYSLIVVGHLERDDLKLLTVDETEAFAGVDPTANYRGIWAHNILDAPPIEITSNGVPLVENLPYGEIATFTNPVGYHHTIISTMGDEPTVLFTSDYTDEPRYVELIVLNGTYPGEVGSDIFRDWSGFGYPGEITVVDGGAVIVGDATAGEVPDIMERVGYTLTLDSDASLNIYVRATGFRTADSIQSGYFDPMFYVYDSSGNLVFWNDEQSAQDYVANSGLERVSLKAGVYTIQIGGFTDLVAGPYTLVVTRGVTR